MPYALAQHTFLTPRGREAHMTYRTESSDWNTVSSIMQPHDEYALAGFNLSGRAADVGAHIGAATVALLLDNPDLRVVAVEPVPPNAELLRTNLSANGLTDRCEVIEAAVGKGRTTTIRYGATAMDGDTPEETENATHHAFIGNSGIVYPKSPKRPHTALTVPVVAIKALLPLDFMKIDCEGGEWGFLASPDVGKIATIVGEVHPTNGHTPLHMAALLNETHAVTFTGPPAGPCGFVAVRRG